MQWPLRLTTWGAIMGTVWQANTPNSLAEVILSSGETATMKSVLAELRRVIPDFHNPVSRGESGTQGNPGALNLLIQDTSEKAYQRAFFLHGESRIVGTSEANGSIVVKWLDIEVPVVHGAAPRRLSLDLIGAVDGKASVIAELKAEDGTSPFHAVQEVLSYGCRAKENHKHLTSHTSYINNEQEHPIASYWPTYEGKYLVVGGPEEYWAKWQGYWDLILAVSTKWLVNSGLTGHRLMFVSFPSTDFREQKTSLEKYTPRVGESRWTLLFETHYPLI